AMAAAVGSLGMAEELEGVVAATEEAAAATAACCWRSAAICCRWAVSSALSAWSAACATGSAIDALEYWNARPDPCRRVHVYRVSSQNASF
ncbi:MAG: hypothetical protein P4M11_13070, partial [Candidatus Pacebacteria bacterium]|nr:hypothetical protein [Candidatus Paceibacterota bacterium]